MKTNGTESLAWGVGEKDLKNVRKFAKNLKGGDKNEEVERSRDK